MKKLAFSTRGWNDYLEWQTADKQMLKRIHLLFNAVRAEPFEGIGKPEPLKHELAGWWSRRITEEHRMVYRVSEELIEIAQLRHHY